MSENLQLFAVDVIDWSNNIAVSDLKQLYGPKLNDTEFNMFLRLCKSTGLNPFLKEVWAIKFDERSPAQIFVARDGYRRICMSNQGYKGHFFDVVYSGDDFDYDITTGQVKHHRNFKQRGNLVGAYCVVMMEGSLVPYYAFANIEEYDKKNAIWKEKPSTMIKKVAECQAIRLACYKEFQGTYSPDEVPDRMLKEVKESKSAEINKMLGLTHTQPEGITFDIEEETTTEPEACPFSFGDVKDMLLSASNRSQLLDAASLVPSMSISKEEKDELRTLYTERQKTIGV